MIKQSDVMAQIISSYNGYFNLKSSCLKAIKLHPAKKDSKEEEETKGEKENRKKQNISPLKWRHNSVDKARMCVSVKIQIFNCW